MISHYSMLKLNQLKLNAMVFSFIAQQDSMTSLTFIGGLVPDACLWLSSPCLNLRFSLSACRKLFSLFNHDVLI